MKKLFALVFIAFLLCSFGENSKKRILAQKQYLLDHLEFALKVEQETCIPYYIPLAQAIKESGGGTSDIGRYGNNHMGFRHFGNDCKTDWIMILKYSKPKLWRSFESPDACYKYYGEFWLEMEDLGRIKIPTTLDRNDHEAWANWYGTKAVCCSDKNYGEDILEVINMHRINKMVRR